jgi:hypothetical protein
LTYVFRTYTCPKSLRSHPGDDNSAAKVWEVARATSAAPRYFSKQTIGEKAFIDGGAGCNNPSERICSEILAVHGKRPGLVLSIGTGSPPGTTNKDRNHKRKLLDHPRTLFDTALGLAKMVANSEDTHEKLEEEYNTARTGGDKYPMYFRFNVPGITSIKLDQWTALKEQKSPNGGKTLQDLENATKRYLEGQDVKERLQEYAIELVRMRRERATTERWERFATHTVYQCPLKKRCGSPPFSSREKLRRHASEHHELVPRVTIDDKPVCLIDHCMETPRLHKDDDDFIKHLREPDHCMKDARPMSTPELEHWLDGGRLTEDMRLKQMRQD